MNDNQIKTFIQAADAGSFSKAAETMYISSSAVMKQINLLERDLDLVLFDRTHRGLKLTEAGISFYKDSKYMLQYMEDSVVRARNAISSNDNVIRIGTSIMTPSQFIVGLWNKIKKFCPTLKFELVPFDNTPENAREILMNLGQNIDIVAGVYDDPFLNQRKCVALELEKEPICLAVPIHHRLAEKERININDLSGEHLMLIRRGWNSFVDLLRDDIWQNNPDIHIVDFPFYDVSVFNQCESSNYLLMVIKNWENVHPFLKIIPVEWDYTIPFGILHAPKPSKQVEQLLQAVARVYAMEEQ
jgi:DNA-binding transcriptional LysR family regulator